MFKALLIVDVTLDFCEDGKLPVEGGNTVASRIQHHLVVHGYEYKTIAVSQCWHPDDINFEHFSKTPDYVNTWPMHGIENTRGALVHPVIDQELTVYHLHQTEYFKKGQTSSAYSAFEGFSDSMNILPDDLNGEGDVILNLEGNGIGLNDWFQFHQIQSVDVVGIATEFCLRASVLDSIRLGYKTTVFPYMCAGINLESSTIAWTEMMNAGANINNDIST